MSYVVAHLRFYFTNFKTWKEPVIFFYYDVLIRKTMEVNRVSYLFHMTHIHTHIHIYIYTLFLCSSFIEEKKNNCMCY